MITRNMTQFASILALAAGMAMGCAPVVGPTQSATAARLPDPGADGQYKVDFPDQGRGSARYIGIDIGPDVAESCRLPKTHFEFDSSEPLPEDRFQLKALADCLRPTLVDGVSISLYGRADPRGTAAYNQRLAERRAIRVKQLLVEMGIPEDRIVTRSTGDLNAVGNQPMYSYGFDRRVDVVLIGLVHAPQ